MIAGQIVKLTQYGYLDDPYGDSLTRQGLGSWDNRLTPTSCALKRSTAARIGAIPRCKIQITWSNQIMFRWWDDVIPERDPGDRCDLYQPEGFDKHLPDWATIAVIEDLGNSPASPL